LHDLSLHIMDLIENSVNAQASIIEVRIEIDKKLNWLCVQVEDDGKGLRASSEQTLDPFYTTARSKRVGLGLSLFKAAAESAGGQLALSRSEDLGGTLVRATMRLTHVDRVPFGDLAATISTMVFANPFVDFHLSLDSNDRSFDFRLSQFARERDLDADSNVDLASAVHGFLREELEAWEKSEMSGLRAQWNPVEAPYQGAEISQ
jgi:anti-sigma regulatory factor (Ser/Thr protein kinase)